MEYNIQKFVRMHSKILNAIRHCNTLERGVIINETKVSWPTVDKAIKDFMSVNMVVEKRENAMPQNAINSSAAHFVGISVGTSEIKVVALGLDLRLISPLEWNRCGYSDILNWPLDIPDNNSEEGKRNISNDNFPDGDIQKISTNNDGYACFSSSQNKMVLSKLINYIFKVILRLDSEKRINLLGIGVSFAGTVDCLHYKIVDSPNNKFLGGASFLDDILEDELLKIIKERRISLCIDNNAKTSVIYGKESLYQIEERTKYKDKMNIASLYCGVGIGTAFIFGGELYRGSSNSCEIGHVMAPQLPAELRDENELNKNVFECTCGQNNCLEAIIHQTVVKEDGKPIFPNSVYLPHEEQILMFYFGYMINIIINLLNVDVLIFSGKLGKSFDFLKNNMKHLKYAYTLPSTNEKCAILYDDALASAKGAAMESYFLLCNKKPDNKKKEDETDYEPECIEELLPSDISISWK